MSVVEDPNWSKEETDYLFQVCQDYDLRWYVIHDRYSFPDGPPRALEVCPTYTLTSCSGLYSAYAYSSNLGCQGQILQRMPKACPSPTVGRR